MIRQGEERDIPAVAAIYDAILTDEEQGRASTGWVRGVYPTEDTAHTAWKQGELYVLEDETGAILAAARINGEQVAEYVHASWEFPAPDEQVLVLHTLVVHPAAKGQGCGRRFVAFYEDLARRLGRPYLRMDTNAINLPARRLYAHLGFHEVGVVDSNFNGITGVKLVCLEKKLSFDPQS